MLKKVLVTVLLIILVLCAFTACGNNKSDNGNKSSKSVSGENNIEKTDKAGAEYTVAMLKGPTALGFIKAWNDSDNGKTTNKYNVTAYGTADEITAGIVKGEIDIAAVPCNLASVLYNKTNGGIKVAAVNTLGVLYMISDDDSIKSIGDLKGKTIYTTGQGTTPEYTLNYILEKNGLTVGTDVKIEYKSEAAEVAAVMSTAQGAVAMLPQPYVTIVLSKNEKMNIVLDMTQEWNKVSDGKLVTGVVIVRNEVPENNAEAFNEFINDYKASVEYVNDNVESAADMSEAKDIFKADIAKKAIPYCNIVFLTDNEMKENIQSYLEVIYSANPQSVGGSLPKEEFYYMN